jgi:glycosyltransferase involved in cell wall biosynthesis
MNIAILNSSISHGGVERQIRYLAEGLSERGHSVGIFTLRRSSTVALPHTEIPWKGFFHPGIRKLFGLPGFLFRFHRAVRSGGFDIMLTWGPYENLAAQIIARANRISHIASVRTNREWAYRFLSIWRRADRIITNADQIRDTLREGYSIDEARLRTIRNGLELERFPYRENPDDSESPQILLVGRFSPSKNQILLLRAMAVLRDRYDVRNFRLVFVGSRDNERYYQEMLAAIAELSLESLVEVKEFNDNIIDEYRRSDLLILPSRSEGVPNVLIEAMACGLPWIASDISDIPWMAGKNEQRGLLFPDDEVDGLVDAIRRWLTMDKNEIDLMRRSGRDFVEATFSTNRMVEQFIHEFEKVLGGE